MGDATDSVVDRAFSGAVTGLVFGGVLGACAAAWQDTPMVVGGKRVPVLRQTAGIIGKHSAVFGSTGLIYSGTERMVHSVRGTDDLFNGVIAGLVAGTVVFSFKTGKIQTGVFAGGLFASASAVTDLFDRRVRPVHYTQADYFSYSAPAKANE